MTPSADDFDHDVVVVGSGFGGSVSALRLAEKGWKVALLEQGRRLSPEDLERAGTDARALAWMPSLGRSGPLAQEVFQHVGIVRGIGLGGGSLVYAAVLLRPQEAFFTDPAWPDAEGGWQAELAPHYATAERMLGLATNPYPGLQDEWLRETARRMGAEPSFGPVPQGIFFGAPGRAHADPFFAGQGPARKGCERCGRCITGCAVGAKNSLDKNYLHLAEKAGVAVRVECQVTHLEKLPGEGYRLHLRHPWQRSVSLPPIRARRVVLSAGVLGTLDILFASRDRYCTLPDVPASLGQHVRTNSEAVVGILAQDAQTDISQGTTISTHFHPDAHTHITQNRFPPSYGFMRMYMGPLVDGARPWRRGAQVLWAFVARPVRSTRSFFARHWYRRMSVLTVMQHADNAMAFGYGRTLLRGGRWGLRSQVPGGARPPSYLPQANAAARHFAQASGGQAMNVLFESLGNLSVTAHVLGGAVIASRPEQGVVDADHQVFGCPGLYVVDASAIPANVGVNPSLTVTALAERFAMRFPHR
ncbi:FAD-dependent oxidoreductase [Simplicispira sedimenti]|jgi:cholesterol oxidase|uniref:FAD-dependent oxidoreductase n=1 Tax=Simplicispira sedimenti TaxID=2919500 RepID=UPI001FAAD187|nr:GMC family oxidoreductase [Acidovorax sp. W1-6]